MRILPVTPRLTILCIAATLAAGCAAAAAVGTQRPLESGRSAYVPAAGQMLEEVLKRPVLVAVNTSTRALQAWPIDPRGGNVPSPLSKPLGISNGSALAANGDVVAIANQNPPELILYDVTTKAQKTLPDPYGAPVDIAIDKNASVYILNVAKPLATVTMYPAGSPSPKELICKHMQLGRHLHQRLRPAIRCGRRRDPERPKRPSAAKLHEVAPSQRVRWSGRVGHRSEDRRPHHARQSRHVRGRLRRANDDLPQALSENYRPFSCLGRELLRRDPPQRDLDPRVRRRSDRERGRLVHPTANVSRRRWCSHVQWRQSRRLHDDPEHPAQLTAFPYKRPPRSAKTTALTRSCTPILPNRWSR
jgi:hypothetical protein